MIRSESKPDLELIAALKESSGDLTNYAEELAKQRSLRSLDLRRVIMPRSASTTFTSMTPIYPMGSMPKRPSLFKSGTKAVSAEQLYSAFNSRNFAAIKSVTRTILVSCSEEIPELDGSSDPDGPGVSIASNLLWCLATDNPHLVLEVCMVIGLLIPHFDSLDALVDEGLASSVSELLASPQKEIVIAACELANRAATASTYARDSFICYGVPELLLNFSLDDNTNFGNTNFGNAYFGNPNFGNTNIGNANAENANFGNLDFEVLAHSVSTVCAIIFGGDDCDVDSFAPILPKLVFLLETPVAHIAMTALAGVTGRNGSFVMLLHNLGVYNKIVPFMNSGDPELVFPTIKLTGNLTLGKPSYVGELLENDLVGALVRQLAGFNTNECSAALWVFSNLIEMSAPSVLPALGETIGDLIGAALDGCDSGSFEVKRESAYLIATALKYVDEGLLGPFINARVSDALGEMMGCGVESVVLQCEQGVMRMVNWAEKRGEECMLGVCSLLAESDIEERAEEILCTAKDSEGDPRLGEYATRIQSFIAGVRSSSE